MKALLLRDAALVFLGGGLGAVARILLDAPSWGPWMPANFLACLLMGASAAWLTAAPPAEPFARLWRALVHTGFLGGLSTFSVLSIAACLSSGAESLAPGALLAASLRLLELLAGFFLACLAGNLSVRLLIAILRRRRG